MNDKVISLLGLAERAGKIASGEFAAEKAVKTGKARLIIVAEDASDNTKKKFSDMCKYYQVPCMLLAEGTARSRNRKGVSRIACSS